MKMMLSQMQVYLMTLCLLSFASMSCTKQLQPDDTHAEFTIAFGSCNHQWEIQPMWAPIIENNPDLWIWLGDIVYADTEDMSKLSDDYYQQKNKKEYRALADHTEVIGIWDDHDYGANNAGKEYAKKDSSKMLLFDFLNVPNDHPSRKRPGAYQSYIYQRGELTIKVILLDVRYFRDEPSSDGTILGKAQWQWFEKELKESQADLHIIGGGIQFLPEDHPYEKWANFPKERELLLKTMDLYNVNHPILISGDRHIAEMSVVQTQKGRQLIEFTSSGLTHSYRGFKGEVNRHRMGSVTSEKNFGVLSIQKKNGKVDYTATIRNIDNEVQTSYNSTFTPVALSNEDPQTEALFAEGIQNWHIEGDAQWTFIGNELIGTVKDGQGYVRTNEPYSNFILELEFKPDSTVNSGVFVRCENDIITDTDCYELNIWDLHPNQDYRTGALVKRVIPQSYVQTINKWNRYKIKNIDDHLQVWVNDMLTVDIKNSELSAGTIALQAGQTGQISFRNVRITSL